MLEKVGEEIGEGEAFATTHAIVFEIGLTLLHAGAVGWSLVVNFVKRFPHSNNHACAARPTRTGEGVSGHQPRGVLSITSSASNSDTRITNRPSYNIKKKCA